MMSLILDIDYKFKKGRKKYALLITICLVTSTVHPTLWAFHTYIYIHIHIYIYISAHTCTQFKKFVVLVEAYLIHCLLQYSPQ